MQETQETWVWSLSWKDLEKGMATHSSILAWKTPWTEEPGGLQSRGLQRVRNHRVTEHAHMHIFCDINEREKNNSIYLSYSPKCSSLIKNVGSSSLVCLSSTPRASPLSSSCSFSHQHSSPCCSPIWAGTEGEVVTNPSLHQGSQLAARICVECRSDHRTHKLETKVSNFFCKRSCSKYVQHCRLCDVCYNHSTLPSWYEKSHRKYVNEWPWLCSNKNVFTKTGWEPDMAQGRCWLTPGLQPFILWPVPLDWNPNSYPACQSQHALALPLLVPSSLMCWVPATLTLLLFLKLALLSPTSGNSQELFLLL